MISSKATVALSFSSSSNNHVRGGAGVINADATALPENLLQVAMRGSAALWNQV